MAPHDEGFKSNEALETSSSYARSKWLRHGKWEKDGGKRRSGVREEDKWCPSRITEDWLWWPHSFHFAHAVALSVFYLPFGMLLLISETGSVGQAAGETFDVWSPLLAIIKRWQLPASVLNRLRNKYAFLTKQITELQNASSKDQS